METIIETVQWTDRTFSVFRVFARDYKYGFPMKNKKVENFVDFFEAYPKVDLKDLLILCSIIEMHATNTFSDPDTTTKTIAAENSCLLSTEGNAASALEVILQHLENPEHAWVFLDSEQKAVVHFVNRKGYYAELYCLATENSSALHLIKYEEKRHLMPVVFATKDVFEKFWSEADALGGYCLRQYLPRDEFAFLSKKGKKPGTEASDKTAGRRDKWDLL